MSEENKGEIVIELELCFYDGASENIEKVTSLEEQIATGKHRVFENIFKETAYRIDNLEYFSNQGFYKSSINQLKFHRSDSDIHIVRSKEGKIMFIPSILMTNRSKEFFSLAEMTLIAKEVKRVYLLYFPAGKITTKICCSRVVQ